jgi:hypothetical protein
MQDIEKNQGWRGLALSGLQADMQQHGCYASKA